MATAVGSRRVPQRRVGLALLVAVALLHAGLYAVLTPPWQAPDEIAHFEYAWLLGQLKHIVWTENASPALEQQIIQSLYDFHAWPYVGLAAPAVRPERLDDVPFYGRSRTLTRFSLSYVIYAAAALPFSEAGIITQLYVMRLVSVLLGGCVVALTYQLARLVEPQAPALAWGSALFVALLPQHAFITGAVSDQSLAELLATISIYGMARVWLRGAGWRWWALIVLSTVGALLSKATALFLVPLLLFSAVRELWHWYTAPGTTTRQRRWATLGATLSGLGLLLALPLILGWMSLISAQFSNILATLTETLSDTGRLSAYLDRLLTSNDLGHALAVTFESFWAYFGWMVVRLPSIWVTALYGLVLLAVGGWVRRYFSPRRRDELRGYGPVGLAAGLALLVVLTWFVSTPLGLEYSQGRYLFGAIAPGAVLLVGGWLGLRPARDQDIMLAGLLTAWVTLSAVALLTVLVPYFYRIV
jgi:hypothetical protein